MQKSKRIVIKVGTKVITSKDGSLNKDRVRDITAQIARVLDGGSEVLLVTSGAIGAGMGLLGLKKRPRELCELQASASIGQSYLMHVYSEYFRTKGYLAGQILLTQEDFNDRKRYLNIKYTIETLLKHKAVPVINENDTVSTDEIKFGDNDRLATLVSDLCEADKLVLLTDVDGLLDDDCNLIPVVEEVNAKVLKLAKVSNCELGMGGMATKLDAARKASGAGIECIIANGSAKDIIVKIASGVAAGTTFKGAKAKFVARKRWIAFSSKPKGSIYIDAGAKIALMEKDKSLLASGIVSLEGGFTAGDVVRVMGKDGTELARGVVNYSSSELEKIKGRKTSDIISVLGRKTRDEVIHKDDLVIL